MRNEIIDPYRPPGSEGGEPPRPSTFEPIVVERKGGRAARILVWGLIVLPLFVASAPTYRSRVVQVRVEGRVVSARGQPVAGEEIDLSLSPDYGYSRWRLDDRTGAEEVAATVTTDANGAYEVLLGEAVYCATVWLVVLETPSRPPPLALTVVFAREPEHPYEVRVKGQRDTVRSRGRYQLTVREKIERGRFVTGVVEATLPSSRHERASLVRN